MTSPRSSTPTWKPPAASRASATSPPKTSTAPPHEASPGEVSALARLSAGRRRRHMTVPPEGRELAVTSPCCASARRRTMNRPMPTPPNLRRSPASPWKNRSKMRSWSPSAMPMPSSSTVTSIQPPPAPFPLHPGPDADRAAFGRVLEGVLEQLPDDDVGGHGVAAGGRQAGGDVRHDDVLVRQRPEGGGGAVQHGAEVERAVADGQLIGAGPRAEQQLLDQPAERPGPLRDGPHRGAPFGVRELVPPAGQRAGESLHHGDGRPQLVAGGGQEQVLRLLELLGRGDVTEVDDQLPAVGERGAQDVEPAPVRQLVGEGRARTQAAGTTAVCRWRPGPASR